MALQPSDAADRCHHLQWHVARDNVTVIVDHGDGETTTYEVADVVVTTDAGGGCGVGILVDIPREER